MVARDSLWLIVIEDGRSCVILSSPMWLPFRSMAHHWVPLCHMNLPAQIAVSPMCQRYFRLLYGDMWVFLLVHIVLFDPYWTNELITNPVKPYAITDGRLRCFSTDHTIGTIHRTSPRRCGPWPPWNTAMMTFWRWPWQSCGSSSCIRNICPTRSGHL